MFLIIGLMYMIKRFDFNFTVNTLTNWSSCITKKYYEIYCFRNLLEFSIIPISLILGSRNLVDTAKGNSFPLILSVCMFCLIYMHVSKILWTLYLKKYWWKLMKFYIQPHFDIIWCWLDFGAYRSRSSDIVGNFRFL